MKRDYYHTPESVKEYIHLAKGVDGAALIDELKSFLKPGSIILEIGSGPGSDWILLIKDFHVTGSDNSREFLKYLRATFLEGQFLELDAVTLAVDEKFDGLYSNKVLHHLNDHELTKSIERQAAILKRDGIVCHSFWKGEGSEIFKGMLVNYQTQESLGSLFSKDFEILKLEPYAEFEESDSLLLIGRKK